VRRILPQVRVFQVLCSGQSLVTGRVCRSRDWRKERVADSHVDRYLFRALWRRRLVPLVIFGVRI
jgi:hypothetical protein